MQGTCWASEKESASQKLDALGAVQAPFSGDWSGTTVTNNHLHSDSLKATWLIRGGRFPFLRLGLICQWKQHSLLRPLHRLICWGVVSENWD